MGDYRLAPCPCPTLSFQTNAFGLVFVCRWYLVPERGSDLYKLIFPSADPKGNQAKSRGFWCGHFSASASSSPTVASFAKPGPWAGQSFSWTWLTVSGETGSLEGAVHISLWYQHSENQEGMELKRGKGLPLFFSRRHFCRGWWFLILEGHFPCGSSDYNSFKFWLRFNTEFEGT